MTFLTFALTSGGRNLSACACRWRMREFPETWTLQKITDAGNHKSATITRGHYMGKTDLLASPIRAAESPATGVWERLQSIRQRFDPRKVFYSHIGQA